MKEQGSSANLTAGDIMRRGILTRNPVLAQAIGLCPLIAVASSLKTAVSLAGISAMLLVVSELLSPLIYRYLPRWLRPGVYACVCMLLILPMDFAFGRFGLRTGVNLGVYLPLLAVNSIIAARCENFAVKNSLKNSLLDGIACSIGYGAVLLIVGLLREMLGAGCIWGIRLAFLPRISGLLMPFGGFLLLGFLAAAVNWLLTSRGRREEGASDLEDFDAASGVMILSRRTETLPEREEGGEPQS